MTQTPPALLEHRIREHPDACALIDGPPERPRRYSYHEFGRLGERAAAWFAARGIVAGDRVALWMVNRAEWLAVYFGLLRLGAAVVAVNTRYRAPELQHLLALSRARMLVTEPGFRGIDFPALIDELDGARLPDFESVAILREPQAGASASSASSVSSAARLPQRLAGRPVFLIDAAGSADTGDSGDSGESAPPDRSEADAPATFYTTSGTTKGPKLVTHLQRTMAGHALDVAQRLGFDRGDARLAAMMPLCGTFGLTAVLGALVGGTPTVLVDAFDPVQTTRLLRDHRITHAFWTDDMLRRLAAQADGDRPFPDARLFGFAAFGPGAGELAETLWARGIPAHGLYGSSEVHALFAIQPTALPIAERVRGGGRPMSVATRVRVRDVESGELLPAGRSGELEFASPNNFAGYFDNPAATAQAITEDGFFRTGDVGQLRADGTFVYQNRGDDSIRLSGFLVDPAEIEDPIKTLPGVADVQVVAIEIAGRQRAVAFVIPADGQAPDPEALIAAAAGLMAPYRTPARVWLVDAFPTTAGPNGTKIQRGRLREMARARIAAEG